MQGQHRIPGVYFDMNDDANFLNFIWRIMTCDDSLKNNIPGDWSVYEDIGCGDPADN